MDCHVVAWRIKLNEFQVVKGESVEVEPIRRMACLWVRFNAPTR